MKKIICNVLAYLFLVNPLMAASEAGKASMRGTLDSNSLPMTTIEAAKLQVAQAGLNETELAEVNNYIDFAVENKIDPATAKVELTAMLNNISYTGASLDGEGFFYGTIVILVVVALIVVLADDDDDDDSKPSTPTPTNPTPVPVYIWTCFADSTSYSAWGTGTTIGFAQNNALSACAANSFSWEICYTYASDCY
jgi:hypothetical protein